MLLVGGDAPTGAHGAGIEFAAVTIVVAHLDGLAESASRIASGAGGRQGLGERIVLNVPGRPVETGAKRSHRVAGRVAEQGAIIHPGRTNNFPGVQEPSGIEQVLDFLERPGEPRAVLPGHPFASHQTVAVLSRKCAFVSANQLGGLLGNRPHPGSAPLRSVSPHVENGTHMKRAHRGVRIPGATRAVTAKHLSQPVGVLRKMLERNRTVLDKAHGLSIPA